MVDPTAFQRSLVRGETAARLARMQPFHLEKGQTDSPLLRWIVNQCHGESYAQLMSVRAVRAVAKHPTCGHRLVTLARTR